MSYGNKETALAAAAAEHGLNPDLMRKAANVAGAYTATEIREICQLVRYRPARFSYSHLARVMRISDKAERDGLIPDAIRLQWSVGELSTALKASRGRRDRVGKCPRVPRGRWRLLVALEAQCLRFGRWVEEARSAISAELREAVGHTAAAWRASDGCRTVVSPDARPVETTAKPNRTAFTRRLPVARHLAAFRTCEDARRTASREGNKLATGRNDRRRSTIPVSG